METNRLRQFCVIAETQNLRKASELLGISHGGLFKSLKVLENELGYTLFRKEGRGIVFTEEGKKFYPKARKFLEAHTELLKTDSTTANTFRIGTFEVFSTYFFSGVLAKELNNQDIVLREFIPGHLEKALIDDEIDVGITYDPIPMQGLQILPIVKCSMGIFGKKEAFKNSAFTDIPFAAPVFLIDSAASGVKGLDGWPDDKIKRRILYKVDMMETALQLCSEGKAVGFFPSFVVKLYNKTRAKDLQLHEIEGPKNLKVVKRTVHLVLRNSSAESQDVKKIAKCLRMNCAET
jgi:DNA-binding transcriptional LysR family regulator